MNSTSTNPKPSIKNVDKKEDNDELLKKAEKEQKEIEEEKAKQDKFFKL